MARVQSWTRRKLIQAFASLPFISTAACVHPPVGGGSADDPLATSLIDAHCHVFNVTDLPAATFAQTVLLKDYPRPGGLTPRQRWLRRILLRIQELVSDDVLTAAAEAAIGPLKLLPSGAAPLSRSEEAELRQQQRAAEDARPPESDDARKCESTGHFSPSIPSLVGWYRSLRSPRAGMTRQLVAAHRKSGFSSRLLCPALVDYSNWLDQKLQSRLPDQIVMGGILARNLLLPPVHGYVAFDPLRRALVRNNLPTRDGNWDPLEWCRKALVEYGYLGVKLYPPMGFRPSGNGTAAQDYPPWVTAAFGNEKKVGEELDASLAEIWSLCEELDAPIMAHAANSIAAGRNYGRRSDPAYWLPVISQHLQLRVMLAHFGRFGTFSSASSSQCDGNNDVPFESSWEAQIGHYVSAHPNSLLFADISFLSEIFDPEDRQRAIQRMKLYLAYDPHAAHLVFGSDWVMLGIEKDFAKGYTRRVVEFLQDCGLDSSDVAGVMYGNALRFLGLTEGSAARNRLLAFYRTHSLPPGRLPS